MKKELFATVALFFMATVICMIGCSVQKPYKQSGVVLIKNMIKPPGKNDFVKMDYIKFLKIYFKDSLVIEERIGFTSVDTSGKEKVNEYTDHYTFINLKTKEHYDYKTFSDTAIAFRYFSHLDSVKNNGGFDFFALKNTTFSSKGESIADTTFDGITYKRVAFDSTYSSWNGTERIKHMAYLRCDLKGLVVSLEQKLAQRMGCPVVQVDWINLGNGGIITAKIEMISSQLSPQESKVFNAWERFANVN